MTLSIGFTGTRYGMTPAQSNAVAAIVDGAFEAHQELIAHHGDCVGADAEFHQIARCYYARITKHPGPLGPWSAGCEADEVRDPLPPMQRNANIVAATDVMIAVPCEATEQRRGGTWSTIRMARRAGRPLAIVYPSGAVERERWPK